MSQRMWREAREPSPLQQKLERSRHPTPGRQATYGIGEHNAMLLPSTVRAQAGLQGSRMLSSQTGRSSSAVQGGEEQTLLKVSQCSRELAGTSLRVLP
jgi:hypothetical protein